MLLVRGPADDHDDFEIVQGLRGPWRGYLKQKVLERLTGFFREQGLPVPADVVIDRRGSRPERRPDFRDYVFACVAVMNDSQLAALQIPADVAHRAAARSDATKRPQR